MTVTKSTHTVSWYSVTRLGDFLSFLVIQISKIFADFWCYYENNHFLSW